MDGKKTIFIFLPMLFFFEIVSILFAGIASFRLIPIFTSFMGLSVLIILALSNLANLSYYRLIFFSSIVLLMTLSSVKHSSKINLGLPKRSIISIEGKLIEDSALTENSNHLMKVSLSKCSDIYGDTASSSGLVTVIGKKRYVLTYGMKVYLKGSFSDELFICEELQVLERSIINDIREYLIRNIQRKFLLDNLNESTLLSLALVIGRTDEGKLNIMKMAVECGVSHVFVLSGMHLGLFVILCNLLFGQKVLGKIISFILIAIFVFIAGPRPSLIRAALLSSLFFIPIEERIALCIIIQTLIFPYATTSLSFCYSYIAIIAIVYLCPIINRSLKQIHLSFLRPFFTTICILILSVPIQIYSYGYWKISAIVASPIMGILASFSMALGLIIMIFGRIDFIVSLNDYVYSLMEKTLLYFKTWPSVYLKAYLILLASVVLLVIITYIQRKYIIDKVSYSSSVIDLNCVPK